MKDMLANIAALVFFVALLFLLIGFFNPGKALFWQKKERTKKRSALVYGLTALLAFVLFAAVSPKMPDSSPKEDKQALKEEPAKATPSESPAIVQPKFRIINTETSHGDDLYIQVLMEDLYSKTDLIEITRNLKEEHGAKAKFVCTFYYKKYAEKSSPVASAFYPDGDCAHCTYKDKDGHLIDFPFYHIEKPTADSLKAIKFDTAGFKQEVSFLSMDYIGSKAMIYSSASNKSLLVLQYTTGRTIFPLVKRTVEGEERYYDAEEKTIYYVIDKKDGLVNLYKSEGLDMQQAIED